MILVSNGCHAWFGYKVVEHIPPNEKGRVPINFATKFSTFSYKLQVQILLILISSITLKILARLRRPPAAFLINGAITRGASGTKTFPWTYPSYMQSFIKIRGAVIEKNGIKIMILCNFNKDRKLGTRPKRAIVN